MNSVQENFDEESVEPGMSTVFPVALPKKRGRIEKAGTWFAGFYDMAKTAFEEVFRFVPYGIWTPPSQRPEYAFKKGKTPPKPSGFTRFFNGLTSAAASVVAFPFALLGAPFALFNGLMANKDSTTWLPKNKTIRRYLGDYRVRKYVVRFALLLGALTALAFAIPAIFAGVTAGASGALIGSVVGQQLLAGLGVILEAIGLGAIVGLSMKFNGFWSRRKIPAQEREVIKEHLTLPEQNITEDNLVFKDKFSDYYLQLEAEVEAAEAAHNSAKKAHGWPFAKARMRAEKDLQEARQRFETAKMYAGLSQEGEQRDSAPKTPASIAQRLKTLAGEIKEANAELSDIKKQKVSKSERAQKKIEIKVARKEIKALKALRKRLNDALEFAVDMVIQAKDKAHVQQVLGLSEVQLSVAQDIHQSAVEAERVELARVDFVDAKARQLAQQAVQVQRDIAQTIEGKPVAYPQQVAEVIGGALIEDELLSLDSQEVAKVIGGTLVGGDDLDLNLPKDEELMQEFDAELADRMLGKFLEEEMGEPRDPALVPMPVSKPTISLDNLPPRLSSPIVINDTPKPMTRVMLSDFESSETFSKTKARALLNSELEGFRDGWAFVERNQERGTYNLYLHRSGAVALYYAKDLKLNETAQYPEGALYCITSEGLQKNGKVIATACDNDSDIVVSGKIKAAVENQIPSSGSDRSFSPAMSLHRSRKLTAGNVSAIQSGMVNDDATDDNVSVASQKSNILG